MLTQAWLAVALAMLGAGASQAVIVTLEVDETTSTITSPEGSPEPLDGIILVEIGALPPRASNTTFDVVAVAVHSPSFDVALDQPSGVTVVGVLSPAGDFLVPTLPLAVEPTNPPALVSPLTLTDVRGTLVPGSACGGELCLELAFEVDPGTGEEGTIAVSITALPEAGSRWLCAFAIATVLCAQRVRGARGSGERH